MSIEKILYRTTAVSTGGREGRAVSDNQALSVELSTPKALGGAGGEGTNPEQLFAAGYSACFLSALKFVAQKNKVVLPVSTQVAAEVGIGAIATGFGLEVKLIVTLSGLSTELSEDLVNQAHIVCPYSNATRNNIDVNLVIKS